MRRLFVVRGFQSLLTLFALSVIVFSLGRFTGSPVALLAPPTANQARLEQIERELGLDRPLHIQYGIYMAHTLRGDLGRSLSSDQPVWDLFKRRVPATMHLTVVGLGIILLLGVPLGVVAALNRGRVLDHVIRIFASFGQAAPTFWLGLILLTVFGVWLNLLPPAGREGWAGWRHVIMPAFVLGAFPLAGVVRLVRSSMLQVISSDYIMVARSKGLSERVVIGRHALRNALLPTVTFMGIILVTHFLTGAVVVETIFAWPGVGALAFESVVLRDFPVLQAMVLISGAWFVLASFVVDISYRFLDPRVRV